MFKIMYLVRNQAERLTSMWFFFRIKISLIHICLNTIHKFYSVGGYIHLLQQH